MSSTKKIKYQVNETPSRSLLSRQWALVTGGFVGTYVVLVTFTGIEHAFNETPICNDDYELPYWVWLMNYTMVCCFALNFILTLNRMFVTRGQHSIELFCSLAANMGITVIAGSSNFMTLVWDYGGLCRDSFG